VINISHVVDVDKPHAVARASGPRPLPQLIGERLRRVMESHGLEAFAVAHDSAP